MMTLMLSVSGCDSQHDLDGLSDRIVTETQQAVDVGRDGIPIEGQPEDCRHDHDSELCLEKIMNRDLGD